MLQRLEQIEARYEELANELSAPELLADQAAYTRAARQHRNLGEIVDKYHTWKTLNQELTGARELLDSVDDDEMREMARAEVETLQQKLEKTDSELKLLLVPSDPNDEKNVIVEIRAGTGGDEASLFAADMLRMYSRYAEKQGWRFEVLDSSESGIGGIKAEEVDVKIDPKELRIDTFCSSGPGGQSVNTTYSAVRITHLPTNVVVSMQDEKSQIKNREKAMRVLRARLQELEEQKQHDAVASERRSMVGSGDRSEKIRTYNFKENRVTDHRIGLTIHQLDLVMEGNLDEIIQALITHDQAEKLKNEAVAA